MLGLVFMAWIIAAGVMKVVNENFAAQTKALSKQLEQLNEQVAIHGKQNERSIEDREKIKADRMKDVADQEHIKAALRRLEKAVKTGEYP